jgi:hypothetical protein
MKSQKKKGQGVVEYAGALVVAALVVGAVVGTAPGALSGLFTGVTTSIQTYFTGLLPGGGGTGTGA